MNLSKIQLETERLQLVPKSKDFAEQIFLEYRDPVIQYMNYGPPESIEVLTKLLQNSEDEMKKGEQLFMVVLLKETKEFLGCLALEDIKEVSLEMGGWMKKSAHGHGYGREAAAALKQWAEKNLKYDHILWPCAVANIASCKLAESLGGKVHREYEKTNANGKTWKFLDYWILKNEEQ